MISPNVAAIISINFINTKNKKQKYANLFLIQENRFLEI